jgi:hypothetical protein
MTLKLRVVPRVSASITGTNGTQVTFSNGAWIVGATAGSAPATFTQSGIGALGRTVNSKLAEIVSITDFGADPSASGATNRAAINNAIGSLLNGGIVRIPRGTYNVDATSIALSSSVGIVLEGEGEGSIIQATSATGNVIEVSGQFATVRGLRFQSSVARSGSASYVNIQNGANRFELRDFHMEGAGIGVEVNNSSATVRISNGKIFNTLATNGTGIHIDGGLDVGIHNVVMDAPSGSMPFAGIYVSNVGDLTISNCDIIHQGQDLFLNPSTGQTITSVFAVASFFDTATRGLYAYAQGGTIARCIFVECWFSSHAGEGIRIDASTGTIDGMDFVNPHIFLNAAGGVVVAKGTNISFVNPAVAQSTGDGIQVSSGVTKFRIIGGKIGDGHGLTGNTGYGINLIGSNDTFVIDGVDLNGNTTGSVNLNSQTLVQSRIIRNCLGFVTENFGTVSGIPNGSGQLTLTHGCSTTPSQLLCTAFDGTSVTVVVSSITSTQAVVTLFSGTTSITTGSRNVYWHAKV